MLKFIARTPDEITNEVAAAHRDHAIARDELILKSATESTHRYLFVSDISIGSKVDEDGNLVATYTWKHTTANEICDLNTPGKWLDLDVAREFIEEKEESVD